MSGWRGKNGQPAGDQASGSDQSVADGGDLPLQADRRPSGSWHFAQLVRARHASHGEPRAGAGTLIRIMADGPDRVERPRRRGSGGLCEG
jgi:hypothetical protein